MAAPSLGRLRRCRRLLRDLRLPHHGAHRPRGVADGHRTRDTVLGAPHPPPAPGQPAGARRLRRRRRARGAGHAVGAVRPAARGERALRAELGAGPRLGRLHGRRQRAHRRAALLVAVGGGAVLPGLAPAGPRPGGRLRPGDEDEPGSGGAAARVAGPAPAGARVGHRRGRRRVVRLVDVVDRAGPAVRLPEHVHPRLGVLGRGAGGAGRPARALARVGAQRPRLGGWRGDRRVRLPVHRDQPVPGLDRARTRPRHRGRHRRRTGTRMGVAGGVAVPAPRAVRRRHLVLGLPLALAAHRGRPLRHRAAAQPARQGRGLRAHDRTGLGQQGPRGGPCQHPSTARRGSLARLRLRGRRHARAGRCRRRPERRARPSRTGRRGLSRSQARACLGVHRPGRPRPQPRLRTCDGDGSARGAPRGRRAAELRPALPDVPDPAGLRRHEVVRDRQHVRRPRAHGRRRRGLARHPLVLGPGRARARARLEGRDLHQVVLPADGRTARAAGGTDGRAGRQVRPVDRDRPAGRAGEPRDQRRVRLGVLVGLLRGSPVRARTRPTPASTASPRSGAG